MQRILLVLAAFALQTAVVADEPVNEVSARHSEGRRYRCDRASMVEATWSDSSGSSKRSTWRGFPGAVLAKGKTMITLPLLAGYTATHPAAISDTGLVVGRASKPAPRGQRVYLRNQAFIWDEATGIRGLGALKDDSASFACGVTRDGTCISGVSVGDGRIRACVWNRVGDAWQGTALPQAGQLGSQLVVISDNGRYVASIDRDGSLPVVPE